MTMHTAIVTARDSRWIEPGTEAHRLTISPSKVGAILGLSRWESPFRLWHRMKGIVPPEEPKDAFDIGHDAEPFAANRWRRKNPGWLLSPGEVQFHVDPDHFGFPAVATLDRRAVRGRSRRVVEFKVARDLSDMEKFGDDFTGDCPADYAAQCLILMLFTGWTKLPAHLLAIGPYWREKIYEIPFDASLAAFIITECQKFWASLQQDEPPPLDDTVATYECLKQLHPEIDGETVRLDPEEALEYAKIRIEYQAADEALAFAKNVLLKRMETAQYAVAGEGKSAKQIASRRANGKGGVSFYPSKTITPEQVRSALGEGNNQ